MAVRNVSSLSIPSLKVVNSTFGVYGSYMESVIAPNLTKIGGDVAFVADSSLTNISMPLLQTIGGGLLIANNSKLMDITGFKNLKSAAGAISISGNFTKGAFPALEDDKPNGDTSGNTDDDSSDDKTDAATGLKASSVLVVTMAVAGGLLAL
ncbi:hypothetical protein VF21_07013 [Pseudogymnoascus sp. 05NY08]|nr:hypothetical protein VF21_07013 [Pseudogymnoascus sp. 05NY08]